MYVGKPPFRDDEMPNELRGLSIASGQPCLWFDLETRLCKHYNHRPRECREFERGGKGCLKVLKLQGCL